MSKETQKKNQAWWKTWNLAVVSVLTESLMGGTRGETTLQWPWEEGGGAPVCQWWDDFFLTLQQEETLSSGPDCGREEGTNTETIEVNCPLLSCCPNTKHPFRDTCLRAFWPCAATLNPLPHPPAMTEESPEVQLRSQNWCDFREMDSGSDPFFFLTLQKFWLPLDFTDTSQFSPTWDYCSLRGF